MKNRLFILFCFALFLVNSSDLFAQIASPGIYRGPRPLGMGNSFTAVANDNNAIFYNPAGLDDVEKYRIDLVDPIIELPFEALKQGKAAYDDFSQKSESGEADELGRVIQASSNLLGNYHGLRIAMAPGFTVHNFSARAVINGDAGLSIRNNVIPVIGGDALANVGVVAGYGMGFMDKLLQFGISGKYIYRLANSAGFELGELTGKDPETGEENSKKVFDNLAEFKIGPGYGADIGFKSHLDAIPNFIDIPGLSSGLKLLRPTVALTLQDALDTSFSVELDRTKVYNEALVEKITKIKQSVNAGLALQPDFGSQIKPVFAMDVRQINEKYVTWRKLYFGAELGIFDLIPITDLSFRVGLAQLRPAAGFTIDWRILKLDLYYYGMELGEYNRIKAAERLGVQVAIGF